MNQKVLASFISFAILLAVWIALTLLKNPDLSGLLDFVKGATMTAWTACALFFETSTTKGTSGDTNSPKVSQAVDTPKV